MNPSYIITDQSITIVIGGKPYTMTASHGSFNAVIERIRNEDFEGIENLFDVGQSIGIYSHGSITVKDNTVLFKNEPVHNHVVDRIFDFIGQGLPFKPLVKFLDKLMANPSRRAVQELYTFLEHKNMPLTPEGDFLAYKSVRANWTDHHTGTFVNSIGSVHEMKRNDVCDNAEVGCSYGFHAGSLEYAKSFGGSDSILLIVSINPADVVSIPKDCNCQKLRTSKYKVVGTFERPLSEPLVEKYSDEQEYDADELWETSVEVGYDAGQSDAENGFARDADAAYDQLEDADFDYSSFCDGYEDGYADGYMQKQSNSQNKSVSEATRAKLRQAALRQKRDANGKFV
jgi:hypothetical protein